MNISMYLLNDLQRKLRAVDLVQSFVNPSKVLGNRIWHPSVTAWSSSV